MRKLFPGYYRPTEEDFKALWDDCLFVFDANVLLNLYRYSEKTCSELLDIMKRVSNRVWIPHQVAFEFHKNRIEKIASQQKAYNEINKIINDSFTKLKNELNKYHKHPFIDIDSFNIKISDLFNEKKGNLKAQEERHPDLFKEDNILNEITAIFNEKVGSPYKEEDLQKIYEEGERRYKREIPPGYSDIKKEGNEKYGDLILWHQVLDKAKNIQKSIILVTDEKKEDWWRKYGDNITIGPKPELIEEILTFAGMRFYMYRSDQFMEYARQYLEKEVEQTAINEVKDFIKKDIDIIFSEKQYNEWIENLPVVVGRHYDNEINKIKEEIDSKQYEKLLYEDYLNNIKNEMSSIAKQMEFYKGNDADILNKNKINELVNRIKYLNRELIKVEDMIDRTETQIAELISRIEMSKGFYYSSITSYKDI